MGECFMTSRGGGQETINQEYLDEIEFNAIPVTAGYCTILASVKSSLNEPVADCYICCNDGGKWYNYHTNEKGKVLFQTNSGQVSITAWNNSVSGGWRILDQVPVNSGAVDAPVSTKKQINLTLGNSTTRNFIFTSNVSNIKILGVKEIKSIQMVGGGAGGTNANPTWVNRYVSDYYYTWQWAYYALSNGGGGGAYNYAKNKVIDSSLVYNIIIGAGGAVNSSGGTTSAFGISAVGGSSSGVGGGSGSNRGGNGGQVVVNSTTTKALNNFNGVAVNVGKGISTGWTGMYFCNFENLINMSKLCGSKSNYSSTLAYGAGGSASPFCAWMQYQNYETSVESTYWVGSSIVNACNNGGGTGGYYTFLSVDKWSLWVNVNPPSSYGSGGYGGTGGYYNASNGYQGVIIMNI